MPTIASHDDANSSPLMEIIADDGPLPDTRSNSREAASIRRFRARETLKIASALEFSNADGPRSPTIATDVSHRVMNIDIEIAGNDPLTKAGSNCRRGCRRLPVDASQALIGSTFANK